MSTDARTAVDELVEWARGQARQVAEREGWEYRDYSPEVFGVIRAALGVMEIEHLTPSEYLARFGDRRDRA